MGYTTDFFGAMTITPPLSEAEIKFLKQFADTRHCQNATASPSTAQELYGVGAPVRKACGTPQPVDINQPPEGIPSLYCQWVPNDQGTKIVWDGGEKFYEASAWLGFLVEHFLKPHSIASQIEAKKYSFLQSHTCSGTIYAQGEDPSDIWCLRVKNNQITTQEVAFDPEGLGEDSDIEAFTCVADFKDIAWGESVCVEAPALPQAIAICLEKTQLSTQVPQSNNPNADTIRLVALKSKTKNYKL